MNPFDINIGDGRDLQKDLPKGTKVEIIGGPFKGESGTISDPHEYLEHSHYAVKVKSKGKYTTFRNVFKRDVKPAMP